MLCSFPVFLSSALTWRMPLTSIRKVHSIWGTPRGAGRRPTRWNRPRVALSPAICRSPCRTWMSTCDWPSAAVEKISVCSVGMVELRLIITVITSPSVSTPKDSGVTSKRTTSLTSPAKTPPWMAAPSATTSSGFTVLSGALPKIASTMRVTAGMRVLPPTRITLSTSLALMPASFNAALQGAASLSKTTSARRSNWARETLSCKWSGSPSFPWAR